MRSRTTIKPQSALIYNNRGNACKKLQAEQKAIQRGLARQSVAEVPSVEGTVEGGGLPHERHSTQRVQSPFQGLGAHPRRSRSDR